MIEKLLAAFGVPDALTGDLLEECARGRSAFWLWRQAIAAIAETMIHRIRTDAAATVRGNLAGDALLLAGGYMSLWLYGWSTNNLPFPSTIAANRLFVFIWHVYCVPLNVLWCATAAFAGRAARRFDRQSNIGFALIVVLAQMPIVLWFGSPYIAAVTNAAGRYPTMPAYKIGYAVDTLVVLVAMPMCTFMGARRQDRGQA